MQGGGGEDTHANEGRVTNHGVPTHSTHELPILATYTISEEQEGGREGGGVEMIHANEDSQDSVVTVLDVAIGERGNRGRREARDMYYMSSEFATRR